MGHKEENWRNAILFQYYIDDAYLYAGSDVLAVRTDRFKLIDNFLEGVIDKYVGAYHFRYFY